MRDSSVNPCRQKAEKVQGDVRCLPLLRIVHGKKVPVSPFVPDKCPYSFFERGSCLRTQ